MGKEIKVGAMVQAKRQLPDLLAGYEGQEGIVTHVFGKAPVTHHRQKHPEVVVVQFEHKHTPTMISVRWLDVIE